MIDERAYQRVLREMASYRPGLEEQVIRQILINWMRTRNNPISETAQDVIWAYQRASKGVSGLG